MYLAKDCGEEKKFTYVSCKSISAHILYEYTQVESTQSWPNQKQDSHNCSWAVGTTQQQAAITTNSLLKQNLNLRIRSPCINKKQFNSFTAH